jgi:hypothetical protein
MTVVLALKPCDVCLRDPSFGVLHVGCDWCERIKGERERQPALPLRPGRLRVYAEPGMPLPEGWT